MRAALVLLVAGHEVASVVADEDKDGVVGEMFLFENAAHPPYGIIDGFDAAVVVGKLSLPGTREGAQIVGHGGVDETRGCPFRRDGLMHVVLLVRFQLRDEEEERFVLFLTKKAFGAVSEKVDAILILVCDWLVVLVPDSALIGMRGVFDRVGAFPEIEKAAAIFELDWTWSAAFHTVFEGEMPLADQVGGVTGLAQLAGKGGQRLIESQSVVPDARLRGIAAGEEDGAARRTDWLVRDGIREVLTT